MIELKCDIKFHGDEARGIVTARDLDGKTIHVDTGNWLAAATRLRFSQAVASKLELPIAAEDVESMLLVSLDRLRVGGKDTKENDFDVSQIVRPDLFITPRVIGLSVPQAMLVDQKPGARWMMYLDWAVGGREVRAMPESLDLLDGSRLWIHPFPCDASPNSSVGWTPAARRLWLEGVPSPDPVEVFKRLCAAIEQFIDFPEENAPGMKATLALWIMLTYVFSPWDAIPYLYVGGPQNSGKSRTFDVLSRLVRRPLLSSNTTGPCLFRTLHDQGGTVLFDEAERLKDTSPEAGELRSILLAGYKRGGRATRLEKVGDQFKSVEYECYGPKALACINGLTPPLASRCIPFIMFRAPSESEKPKRRVDADPELWANLRDDLHALVLGPMGQAAPALSRRSDVCALGNRNYELWQPIMALAHWLEGLGASGLLAILQAHAAHVVESSVEDATPDTDETLLRILAAEIVDGQMPTPGEVLAKAKQMESETFQRWQPRTISNVLKRYGLMTKRHGSDGRRYRDVTIESLRKIERTYHLDLSIRETSLE